MTTYITTHQLSVSFSTHPLFEEVTITLQQGQRIGLIGHNGCGKSTLLKLLAGQLDSHQGQCHRAKQCQIGYVEQHLPSALDHLTLQEALAHQVVEDENWRADVLLDELGFSKDEWSLPLSALSGGQQMRLLLGRAVINRPNLLLLDEPSNHLDLPSLLWLEQFLMQWKGAFVVISHDQRLLDKVTDTTWLMRDQKLYHFAMPCSQARRALVEQDEADAKRHQAEQNEIDRLDRSAKRLAMWGKNFDNEDLARKAKTMQARKARLQEEQTQLTQGTPWRLQLRGESLPANRLLEFDHLTVKPQGEDLTLFTTLFEQIKSGDRVAIIGANGAGKSTLLKAIYDAYQQVKNGEDNVRFHPQCHLGYYDQSLQQIDDEDSLVTALSRFTQSNDDVKKQWLIRAGFAYARHGDKVKQLSGGERARLLFVGISLADYHLVLLDEPTNHLDLEGKEELVQALNDFNGGAIVVSHDRDLIELGCNRYFCIHQEQLIEHHDLDKLYRSIAQTDDGPQTAVALKPSPTVECRLTLSQSSQVDSEEELLERLIELETLLSDDLARKVKFQKPDKQREWQQEIEQISAVLD